MKDDGVVLKNNIDHQDPHRVLDYIKKLENEVEQQAFLIDRREDVKVNIRCDESIAPAMFKRDPLIPHGYVANSLTIRAMRPNIFVLGETTEDLETIHECPCGVKVDVQFWKLCPYCSRSFTL